MNKIALITGGTSGVGLSLVKELAKQNYDVYFIGTNEQKGLEIETELNAFTLSKSTFIRLDLSNLKEVKKFISNFKKEIPHLNLLANVAGGFLLKREETNGIEKTFAVAYLSSFLLCKDLKGLLEKAENARIVNVAGSPKQILETKLDFNDINFEKKYSAMNTIISSIHAKTVLTEILAEKYKDKGITVNSFHPGIIKGNLTRNMPLLFRLVFSIAKPIMATVSKTGVYVCTAKEIENITGKLFVKSKAISLNFDEQYKKTLWEKTLEIIANQ